jgi:hypothetical protein
MLALTESTANKITRMAEAKFNTKPQPRTTARIALAQRK